MGDSNKPRSETGSFEKSIRSTGTMNAKEVRESIARANKALDDLSCEDGNLRGTILGILANIKSSGKMTYDQAVNELIAVGDVEKFKNTYGHTATGETEVPPGFRPRETTGNRPRPNFIATDISAKVADGVGQTLGTGRRTNSSGKMQAVNQEELDRAMAEQRDESFQPVEPPTSRTRQLNGGFDPKAKLHGFRGELPDYGKLQQTIAKIRSEQDKPVEDELPDNINKEATSAFAKSIQALGGKVRNFIGGGKKKE